MDQTITGGVDPAEPERMPTVVEPFDAEARFNEMSAKLDGILNRFVPVSAERLDKLWSSVRETLNEFSAQLAANQEDRRLQNEAIASMRLELDSMRNSVTASAAAAGIGMPVPKE